MGQKPFGAGSPAGYSQLNRDWMGSDALMKRIDWVNFISKKTDQSPKLVADRIFDSKLSPLTAALIEGAESSAQGLALLFLSGISVPLRIRQWQIKKLKNLIEEIS